ncbi:beta-lactamase/transpeptidase-like protein [Mycena sp. CBHHK59/15]|nr:beta-lactamase/transpeptidase-like protein [Mycena sp. CBHHK59/15]
MTKLITTIAALQLIEQGKIALSTPVAQVLPELADPVILTGRDAAGKPATTAPAQNAITLGHLLNHTSGMEYNLECAPSRTFPAAIARGYGKDEDSATFFEVLKGALPGQLLKFEPGTDFAYGLSTHCVGFIVERLSGKSLDQYFKDHIFTPLGITSASFYLTPALKERLLPLSFRNSEGTLERWNNQVTIMPQDPEQTNVHFGGAGLYGSLKDYLTLLRHLLQIKAGTAVAHPLLAPASVASLFEPTLHAPATNSLATMLGMPAGSAQFSRGLMLNTVDLPGRRRVGSGSWAGWACTSFVVDPDTGVAVLWVEVEEAIYAGLQK